jgi:pimeloyl-ACP methyl ester carboxylesterase
MTMVPSSFVSLRAQNPAQSQQSAAGVAHGIPRFVEVPCNPNMWGTAQGVPDNAVKCGTVTVPQNRQKPNDPKLVAVALPVVVYTLPGATGTPVVFLPGGPGESAIDALQRVFLNTSTGQMLARERPIIAFDHRGFSPVYGRAVPDLGTIVFEPRSKRDLAVAPLRDSLTRLARELRSHGVDPKNFITREAVDDIADVAKALHYDKIILFGASYGSHESLQFMQRHREMVELAVLDGIAPPSAPQVLDSTYMARIGRSIVDRVVEECQADAICAAQYADLPQALATLGAAAAVPIRRTAHYPVVGEWRTIEVTGQSVLSVLGVAATSEDVRASIPRIIVEFAAHDTLIDDLSPRVLLAAAIDPSLQTTAREVSPLVQYVALCGDRPKGEPKGGNRQLCDALDVPFGGPEAIAPISSDIPVLLMSSGYDAQTPAELADEAAKTLPHSQRVHFAKVGHVAFTRPLVTACVALVVESFLQRPNQAPPTGCIGNVSPAFVPRGDVAPAKPPK